MSKLELKGKTLIVKDGEIKHFNLDELRLVFLIFPGAFSWQVLATSQEINSVNIDRLDDAKLTTLSEQLLSILKKSSSLKLFKLYIANYSGHTALLTLSDLKNNGIDLFPVLVKYKKERLAKRKEWVESGPRLELKGKFGSRMILNPEGVKVGGKYITWDKVSSYQIEKTQLGFSHFMIIPVGVSTGLFSFGKYKYCLRFISTKKYPLYMSECEFWRNLKDTEGSNDMVSQLKKLQQLKEEGVLTQERFEEAKKKLLEVGS